MAKHPPMPRKNQPTGLAGRREATRPPIIALTVTPRGKTTALTSDLLSKASATAQTTKTAISLQTDQASQAARWLILPSTRSCSLAAAVTTPLYSSSVSRALRRTLRRCFVGGEEHRHRKYPIRKSRDVCLWL